MEKDIDNLERPSERVMQTSLQTAYFLGFSDIPFAKEVSILCGADNCHYTHPQNIPVFEARYKAIDALVKRNGMIQVVEFAAGRTVRGINNPQWNYIHSDLDPSTLKQMRTLVKSRFKEKPNIHFINFDVISGEGLEEILKNLREERTAVVHAGFTTYFPNETRAKIAERVKFFLNRFGGVYITPDIPTEEYHREVQTIIPDEDERIRLRSKQVGRDLRSFYFKTYKEAFEFYSSLGFNIQRYHFGDLVGNLASVNRLFSNSEQGKNVETVVKNKEIWAMTL